MFPPEWKLEKCFSVALDAGYDGIEVAIDEAGECSLESSPSEVEEIGKAAERAGIGITSLATGLFWRYSLSSPERSKADKARSIVHKMLENARLLGTDAILVVPGAVHVFFDPESVPVPYDQVYKASQAALREAAFRAEELGVSICIENVWNKFLQSPMEFARYVDEIGSPRVQAYFDAGNVLLTGYPEHWIPILAGRIHRVHVKDFRQSVGTAAGFVNLLEGDVNWPEVIKALRKIGYDGYVTAEVLPPYRFYPERLVQQTSAALDSILAL